MCSSLVFPSIDFSMAAPTECAVSTLTVGWACTPVVLFRRFGSLLNGFRSCRYLLTVSVSVQSQACLVLLIFLFCSPVLWLAPRSSCMVWFTSAHPGISINHNRRWCSVRVPSHRASSQLVSMLHIRTCSMIRSDDRPAKRRSLLRIT